jgi:hypothetical protein
VNSGAKSECFDVIVIGTGIAGLSAASPPRGRRLGKRSCQENNLQVCNTHYAQGGIVARRGRDAPDVIVMTSRWPLLPQQTEGRGHVSTDGLEQSGFLIDKVGFPSSRRPGNIDRTKEAPTPSEGSSMCGPEGLEHRGTALGLRTPSRGSVFPGKTAIDFITNTTTPKRQQRYDGPVPRRLRPPGGTGDVLAFSPRPSSGFRWRGQLFPPHSIRPRRGRWNRHGHRAGAYIVTRSSAVPSHVFSTGDINDSNFRSGQGRGRPPGEQAWRGAS